MITIILHTLEVLAETRLPHDKQVLSPRHTLPVERYLQSSMSGALSGDGVLFCHHWPKIHSQYTGNTDYTIMFNIDLLLVKILFYNWYWLQWLYFK